MDRDRLALLLRDPSQVEEGDLPSLRSMAERYPWFGGARLLLAVGEHHAKDLLAHGGQGLPAAFLPSREVLFDLVHHKADGAQEAVMHVVRDDVPEAAPPLKEEADTPELPAALEEPATPAGTSMAPGIPDRQPASSTTEVEVPAMPLRPEEATAGEEPLAAAMPSPAPPMVEKDPQDRAYLEQIYAEALASQVYDLGQLAGAPPSAPEPPLVSTIVPAPASTPDPVPAPVPPTAVAPPPIPSRMRFTDWLELESSPAPDAPSPSAAASPGPGPLPPEIAPKVALSATEILDRFIQQGAPPPKEKAAFFTPQQAAKRSLNDDGMVSETLARIHEKQGNFAKAKDVYDRLAAKHPEKSIYFAALSKALEARLNK